MLLPVAADEEMNFDLASPVSSLTSLAPPHLSTMKRPLTPVFSHFHHSSFLCPRPLIFTILTIITIKQQISSVWKYPPSMSIWTASWTSSGCRPAGAP